jgi:hypothetical protein
MYGMRFGDAVRKVLKDVRRLLLKGDTRVLLAKPGEAYRAWIDWGNPGEPVVKHCTSGR